MTNFNEEFKKVFHYDDNIMSYECKINQYEFHLVHDVDTLFKLGNILTTYIASYRENIVKKELVTQTSHKRNRPAPMCGVEP